MNVHTNDEKNCEEFSGTSNDKKKCEEFSGTCKIIKGFILRKVYFAKGAICKRYVFWPEYILRMVRFATKRLYHLQVGFRIPHILGRRGVEREWPSTRLTDDLIRVGRSRCRCRRISVRIEWHFATQTLKYRYLNPQTIQKSSYIWWWNSRVS